MRKLLIVLLFCVFLPNAFAETIVVGGKPYEIKETSLNVCGEEGSPELAAAGFVIDFTQKNGENVAKALCGAGEEKYCHPDAVKKFGMELVFKFIRSYPAAKSNAGCKALRENCEKRCNDSKQFIERDCAIECNQYETWNR